MKDKNTPAFPSELIFNKGLTAVEYAAIKLRVPESGTDWLDDMIRKSQRNDLAARAMQGLLSRPGGIDAKYEAELSLIVADAMIAAQEQK